MKKMRFNFNNDHWYFYIVLFEVPVGVLRMQLCNACPAGRKKFDVSSEKISLIE